jgi:hypothetical protein
MKVDQKGHTTIIRNTQGTTALFLQKVLKEYHTFQKQNLILDLSQDKDLSMEDVKSFAELIKTHAKAKKSLILVADSVNFNAVPNSITLVPTVLEAHDMIEMDEIERDLGF